MILVTKTLTVAPAVMAPRAPAGDTPQASESSLPCTRSRIRFGKGCGQSCSAIRLRLTAAATQITPALLAALIASSRPWFAGAPSDMLNQRNETITYKFTCFPSWRNFAGKRACLITFGPWTLWSVTRLMPERMPNRPPEPVALSTFISQTIQQGGGQTLESAYRR